MDVRSEDCGRAGSVLAEVDIVDSPGAEYHLACLYPVDARHHYVHYNEVYRTVRIYHLYGSPAVFSLKNAVSLAAEQDRYDLPDIGVIINYEYLILLHQLAFLSSALPRSPR